MLAIILIFLMALTVTSVSTPWVRRVAIALHFVDEPAQRKLHSTPMPLLGGLAIFGGAILVLAVYFRDNRQILGVLLAAALISAVGLWDDRRGLPPWLKFAGQLLGIILAALLGVHVRLPVPMAVNYALTVIWFGAIINAVNFLDNMDGLCAGVSAVAAAFITLLAALNGQFLVAPMAAAVLGACLGFLRYNFRPARIFMGDAGSLLLGFLLAVMTLQLRFPDRPNTITWLVPLFILGLPLFDLALVIVSRLRRRVNPLTTAGKDHLSHRLAQVGFSQREAVLILYLLGGAFGMQAIFITQADRLEAYLVAGVTLVLAGYGIWLAEFRPPAGA